MTDDESTQAQELSGKTEQLEAEIKRLQELADYRLKLLTKMPSEWVGLTDQEINDCLTFNFYRLTLLTKMPSEWVGLTDEELKPLCDEWRIIFGAHVNMFAREIESKLKEQQMIINQQGCAECGKGSGYALYCVPCHDEFKVWEGLTDEDIAELRRNGAHSVSDADFRTIEARLKELNT